MCLHAYVPLRFTWLRPYMSSCFTCLRASVTELDMATMLQFCFACLCVYVSLLNYVPTWMCLCNLGVYMRTCILCFTCVHTCVLDYSRSKVKKSLIQGCLPQVLLGQFLSILSQMSETIEYKKEKNRAYRILNIEY